MVGSGANRVANLHNATLGLNELRDTTGNLISSGRKTDGDGQPKLHP